VFLVTETSEEIPDPSYVGRIYRALGERGILSVVSAVLTGRPKAYNFDKHNDAAQKAEYRERQREVIIDMVRRYNKDIPIVQNLDFGHTDPQIAMPYGGQVRIDGEHRKIYATY